MTDASVLDVGTQCFYRKRDGTVATVVVLKVHHDEQPPYYTIGIDATRHRATEGEKQTEREKLRPCSQGPWPEEQVTPEVTRQLSVKSVAALDKLARCSPDAHALFRQIDKNGDGAITVRELCEFFVSTDDAFARRLFKAIDIDDDGLIDIDEFRLAHKTATERRGVVLNKAAAERAAAEKKSIERAAAEKEAAKRAAAEKVAAEKAAAEKAAAEKAAAKKAAAEKAEALQRFVEEMEEPVEKKSSSIVSKLSALGADTNTRRAAVGGVIGFVGGTAVRKTQDLVLTCGLLGGAAVAGACYFGYIEEEDIAKVVTALSGVSSRFGSFFSAVVDVKLSDFVAAPGLTTGVALGFALGYKMG